MRAKAASAHHLFVGHLGARPEEAGCSTAPSSVARAITMWLWLARPYSGVGMRRHLLRAQAGKRALTVPMSLHHAPKRERSFARGENRPRNGRHFAGASEEVIVSRRLARRCSGGLTVVKPSASIGVVIFGHPKLGVGRRGLAWRGLIEWAPRSEPPERPMHGRNGLRAHPFRRHARR